MTGMATQEPDAPAGKKPRWFAKPLIWALTTFGAAVAGVVAVVVNNIYLQAEDGVKDWREEEPIRAVASSRPWEGDVGAFEDALLKGSDRFLLLRGATREQWDDLVRRHKGAQVGYQYITVVIQGLRNRSVRIIDVRPRILSAGPVFKGTCIQVPTAGDAGTYNIKADLDHLRPGYGTKNRSGTFLGKSIELAANDRVTVQLSTLAHNHSYEYDVEIIYDYGDNSELQESYAKQSNGDAFRVTGPAKKYKVSYTEPGLTNSYRASRNKSC